MYLVPFQDRAVTPISTASLVADFIEAFAIDMFCINNYAKFRAILQVALIVAAQKKTRNPNNGIQFLQRALLRSLVSKHRLSNRNAQKQ